VRRLYHNRHAWPVGRIRLQKLAYFATAVGVPTGLEFTEGSYGPFAHALTPLLGQLANNDVLTEGRSGRMLAVRPGPAFDDARARHHDSIQAHEAENRARDRICVPGWMDSAARPLPASTSPLTRLLVR
jgi:hypothetical protein